MIFQFIRNVAIVCFMLSLFVALFMYFCRDYRHFNGIKKKDDVNMWDAYFNRFYLTSFVFINESFKNNIFLPKIQFYSIYRLFFQ